MVDFKEGEVDSKMSFNFFNCENLKVSIPAKVKSFMLQRCNKVELHLDACISKGEVIKCEQIQLHLANKVPQVSIELSSQVDVFATE